MELTSVIPSVPPLCSARCRGGGHRRWPRAPRPCRRRRRLPRPVQRRAIADGGLDAADGSCRPGPPHLDRRGGDDGPGAERVAAGGEDDPRDLGTGRRPGLWHLVAGPDRPVPVPEPRAAGGHDSAVWRRQLRAGPGRRQLRRRAVPADRRLLLARLPGLANREQQPVRDVEPQHAGQPDVLVLAAAAPEPQHRLHAAADPDQQEQLRDQRHAVPQHRREHRPRRQERLLGPGGGAVGAGRAAADAGALAADARRQPQARRGGHDGPHRHRAGRGRGGRQRGGR